ncbi:Protein of unknown function [Bacillus sp. OV166]|uniref:DUF3231 family protein n=1 Tax=Bacillus sp. OV166 TaxID=1882763 RepID=UPI000A2AA4E7|nr:DUF3231 family protein [Bacillus sp. OV166]SMQ78204.1 Protein of unknown function [Bacillus sp. OV166]
MNNKHEVGFTSTEIGALWSTYISDSMNVCLSKYFLKHLKDEELRPLLSESLNTTQTYLEENKNMFIQEKFPVPRGYTEEDVNLSAPPLFSDPISLSYLYGMCKIAIMNDGMLLTSVAREDVRLFFSKRITSFIEFYNQSVQMMLTKGIYDRPQFIPYPDRIEFVKEKGTILSKWFEPSRSLNVLELTDIFFNSERNLLGKTFLTAFIQIVKDENIKNYLIRGKKLAQKQIEFLNDTLTKDDLPENSMINATVSLSTVSPFSDRFILGMITLANSTAITYIGHAISTASRIDLATQYSKFLIEIMIYGKDGIEMLIEREWMEEPPHTLDRK